MRLIGDYHKLLEKANTTKKVQACQKYAIVENGRLIVTNGRCLIMANIVGYVSDGSDENESDMLMAIEGKAFDKDLLKNLAQRKWEKIIYKDSTIELFDKDAIDIGEPSEVLEYVAQRDYGVQGVKKFNFFNGGGSFEYPDCDRLSPKFSDDVTENSYEGVSLDAKLVKELQDCFFANTSGVQIWFPQKSKDKEGDIKDYPHPVKNLKVTPIENPLGETGLIVPICVSVE